MRTGVMVAMALCAGAAPASAAIVDFESAPLGNTDFYSTRFLDRGYEFRGTALGDPFAGPPLQYAQNDSRVYFTSTNFKPITLQRVDGRPFDLISLDISELWIPPFPFLFERTASNATTVRLTGVDEEGATVMTTVSLDGIVDGAGGADDFQSFAFGGFTDMVSIEMEGEGAGSIWYLFGIDNVHLVPGPGTLLFTAGGALGLLRRRRSAATTAA